MRRTPLAIGLFVGLVLDGIRLGRIARDDVRSVDRAERSGNDLVLERVHRARARSSELRVRRFSQEVSVDHGEEHRQHEPDKLTAAIRGGNAPDAVSLFETDTLGAFCSSGAWLDLTRTSRVIT